MKIENLDEVYQQGRKLEGIKNLLKAPQLVIKIQFEEFSVAIREVTLDELSDQFEGEFEALKKIEKDLQIIYKSSLEEAKRHIEERIKEL